MPIRTTHRRFVAALAPPVSFVSFVSFVALAAFAALGETGCHPPARPMPMATPSPPSTVAPKPVQIANAELSPRAVAHREVQYARLRSEGVSHALERNRFGIVLMSEDAGVLGFLRSPGGEPDASEVAWAGFVSEDALVVLHRDTWYRAASLHDAQAGRFVPLSHRVEPGPKIFASGGGKRIAYAFPSPPRLFVSDDNGQSFSERKPPETTQILGLQVRRDGVIVIAHDAGKTRNTWGHDDQLAQVYASRGTGWKKGPRSQSHDAPSVISHVGDVVTVALEKIRGQEYEARALTRDGQWASPARTGAYLDFAYPSNRFFPEPAVARPPYPTGGARADEFGAGDLLGVLGGNLSDACRGATCLSHRSFVGMSPNLHALNDGVCPASDVVARKETLHVVSTDGKPAHDEEITHQECDPAKVPTRTSALVFPTQEGWLLGRLPAFCASGTIVGTPALSLLACDGQHRGQAGLFALRKGSGMSFEQVANMPPDAERDGRFRGAESATDGTTVIAMRRAVYLCAPAAADRSPSCAPLPPERLLAARPLPRGRALLALRGATDDELELQVTGGEWRLPSVRIPGNLLEFETTERGFVRLWTHPRQEHWTSVANPKYAREVAAFIVLIDGSLQRDEEAGRKFVELVKAKPTL